MTYVREQTSAELAAHMRSLQAMPGWFDPLADRLWQEVQQLQRDNAALMEDAAAQIQIAREAVERADRLMAACRLAILALARAAEKDPVYRPAYEALDAVLMPGRHCPLDGGEDE